MFASDAISTISRINAKLALFVESRFYVKAESGSLFFSCGTRRLGANRQFPPD
jgi:hypothetical protein